jgi:hypothetical protein
MRRNSFSRWSVLLKELFAGMILPPFLETATATSAKSHAIWSALDLSRIASLLRFQS